MFSAMLRAAGFAPILHEEKEVALLAQLVRYHSFTDIDSAYMPFVRLQAKNG